MRRYAVVLALGAMLAVGASTAGGRVETSAGACVPVKQVYSEKHWRQKDPGHGLQVCPATNQQGARATVQHFREYQRYRHIATMKCLSGAEGWFVPNPGSCTTLKNESGLRWSAKNTSSGAEWVYQLLGGHTYPCNGYVRKLRCRTVDGGPDPSTFLGRLENHEIASTLSRGAWTAPG